MPPSALRRGSARRVAAIAAILLALAVAAAFVAGRPREREAWPAIERPNVVVVVGCTVRRDQTTPYGGPATTTPFLASLAADGARFDDALATSSWTREAVAGLLTGTPAASFGLPDPGRGESRRVLVEAATTLAERFRDAGWHTIGLTANPNLNTTFGLAQGFAHYRDAAAEKGFATRNRQAGTDLVADALAELDARNAEEGARPFYLQVVLIDAHTPRAPTRAELRPFRDPAVPRLVQEYRAVLRRLDDAVAALADGLDRRGHGPANTVFVFVADHGEGLQLPEHHLGGHGKRMYPSTVSVPWIVRGPGIGPGGVVTGLASGEDFAPTVLGLAGLPPDRDVPGRDWSALVRDGGRTDRDRAFSLSMFLGVDVASIWTADRQCQLDGGSDPSGLPMVSGCFDRGTDPTFSVPRPDEGLAGELRAWREARLAEGRAHEVSDARVPDETHRQLEILGYVE